MLGTLVFKIYLVGWPPSYIQEQCTGLNRELTREILHIASLVNIKHNLCKSALRGYINTDEQARDRTQPQLYIVWQGVYYMFCDTLNRSPRPIWNYSLEVFVHRLYFHILHQNVLFILPVFSDLLFHSIVHLHTLDGLSIWYYMPIINTVQSRYNDTLV